METVSLGLPDQHHQGFKLIIFAFFLGRFSESLNVFGKIIDDDQNGRLDSIGVLDVIFVQR